MFYKFSTYKLLAVTFMYMTRKLVLNKLVQCSVAKGIVPEEYIVLLVQWFIVI